MPRHLTLALVQFLPRKGDYAANLERLTQIFAEIARMEPRVDVAHLPETALSGYFLEGGVRDNAVTAGTLARDADEAWREAAGETRQVDVVIGFYERWRDTLHNSALYATLGGEDGPIVRHVHRKVFLPTYGMFDEERFVERGHAFRAFDAPWGRAGLLVCEDAWHSLSGTIVALDGAQLVFVCSAAPARGVWPREDEIPGPASVARWERLVRDIADEHGVFVSLANLAGSEGGKVFQGSSQVIGPRGDVRARSGLWHEEILSITLDLDDLTRTRAEMPLLSDLRTALPHLRDTLDDVLAGERVACEFDPAVERPSLGGGGHLTLLPDSGGRGGGSRGGAGEARAKDAEGAIPVASRSAGGANVVIGGAPHGSAAGKRAGGGNAGGGSSNGDSTRDSGRNGAHARTDDATESSLAGRPLRVVRVETRDHGLPPSLELDGELVTEWLVHFIRAELARRRFEKAVVGISGGVDSAVTAYLAARALGPENVLGIRLPYRTSSAESLDHGQLVIEALGIRHRTLDISQAVDGYLGNEPDADGSRRGNVMARVRMIALFDLSAKHHAIPLGTGNKTERLFGYFTWHADDSPPVNPLGDLFKTQVWALARHLGVPEAIVSKPPTADLVVGQTDEGDFGISYARADEILNWMLSGYTAAELAQRGFDAGEVETVRKRLEGTHWKRRLPTVALMSPTAIGESYLRPVDY